MVEDAPARRPKASGGEKYSGGWFALGSRLAWARERADDKRKWTAMLEDAARSTGYSPGMLRRFAVAAAFLKTFPFQSRPAINIVGRSFAAVELIQRISELDARLGSQLLADIDVGAASVNDLRKMLSALKQGTAPGLDQGSARGSAPSDRPGGHPSLSLVGLTRNDRERETMSRLRVLLPALSGRTYAFGRPEGAALPGLRCDAIAWTDRDLTAGDGYEFAYVAGGNNRANLSDLVSRITVASTLFRRFFVCFSHDSLPEAVPAVIESLDLLKANSIGVVFLSLPRPLLRRPKGAPVPDRRHLLPELCLKGRWTRSRHWN